MIKTTYSIYFTYAHLSSGKRTFSGLSQEGEELIGGGGSIFSLWLRFKQLNTNGELRIDSYTTCVMNFVHLKVGRKLKGERNIYIDVIEMNT